MTSPGAEGPWTIRPCPECGMLLPRSEVCPRHPTNVPVKPVEVVDRRVADDLAEALEAARPWMDTYEDNMGLPDFEAREKAIEQVEKALASSEGATREEQT